MHVNALPAILYFGTPVVLVSTLNDDGTTNIAPISSAWWLGWSCMLGLDASSRTTENLKRTGECLLNLPDAGMVQAVNRLALLTGSETVPLHKKRLGYKPCRDKFAASGLTPQAAPSVAPARIQGCPVQMEARLVGMQAFACHDPRMAVPACAFEVQITHIHVEEGLLTQPGGHKIDPDRWRPLIMSFRRFYSLTSTDTPSTLAQGPESAYAPWRGKFIDRVAGVLYRSWAQRRYKV